MKRFLSIALAFVMAFSLAAVSSAVTIPSDGADMSGKTVIIHTNDSHSRVDENYGFTAVSALKKQYEAAGANVLVFDAGDTLHGMPIATMFEGESIVDILNLVGYDAMTAGNHDFNYGSDKLAELAGKMDFPVLAANVTYKETGEPLLGTNTVIMRGGIKFGVFGLASPETVYKTHPDNVAGLDFLDPIETASLQVAELNAQGCDYIICIGHIGLDESTEITSADICGAVDGIDVFIDGHSHTVLPQGMTVNGTVIASTGEYIKNIGVVTIDNATGAIEAGLVAETDAYEGRDDAVDELIGGLRTELEALLGEVVGYTDVYLNGERQYVRTQETNLGDLAADALVYVSGADCAMTNGGGIRASIEVGDITKGDLVTVFPFGNYVVTKYVTGSAIHDMLEHGVRAYPESLGGFPQVSGIEFKFDPTAEAYDRVDPKDVLVGGEPLELEREYLFATNDFIAAGGDGYTMLGEFPIATEYAGLDEVLIQYISSLQSIGSIYSAPLGRIQPYPYHTVTISSTANGMTAPTGSKTVLDGASLTIEMKPDAGCYVWYVSVNGEIVAVRPGNSITFENITEDLSVFVCFKADAPAVNVPVTPSEPSQPPKTGAVSMTVAAICAIASGAALAVSGKKRER